MALFIHRNPETGALESTHVPNEPRLKVSDFGSEFVVEFERDEDTTDLEVQVTIGEDDNVQFRTFTVDDTEPMDVEGPIFSRIFDELGIVLSDPGDFGWTDLSKHPHSIPNAYLVEINCPFTES